MIKHGGIATKRLRFGKVGHAVVMTGFFRHMGQMIRIMGTATMVTSTSRGRPMRQ